MGFEPTTCCLRNSCSTAELKRQGCKIKYFKHQFSLIGEKKFKTHQKRKKWVFDFFLFFFNFRETFLKNYASTFCNFYFNGNDYHVM